MYLWYPESREEVGFVHSTALLASAPTTVHTGIRAIDHTLGVTGSDYRLFPGVPFVTTKADGTELLAAGSYGTSSSCITSTYSQTSLGLAVGPAGTCASAQGICKVKLGN